MGPLLARLRRSVQSLPRPAPAWLRDVAPGSSQAAALGMAECGPRALQKGLFPRWASDNGRQDIPQGSSASAAASQARQPRGVCPCRAAGRLPALQVLGDQVGFVVLREVVAPHEAFLALGALEALVTCGEEQRGEVRGWQPPALVPVFP